MSSLNFFLRGAVLGLCRERVPLGVQARGLKLSRHDVKATALEFFAKGMIGELPADDIRAGRAFSWPETMLPDAPTGTEDVPDLLESQAPAAEPQTPLASQPVGAGPKIRYWQGRVVSSRHLIGLNLLAGAPPGSPVSADVMSEGLKQAGFSGSRKSVQVLATELRRMGFVVRYLASLGYELDDASRAKWLGRAR